MAIITNEIHICYMLIKSIFNIPELSPRYMPAIIWNETDMVVVDRITHNFIGFRMFQQILRLPFDSSSLLMDVQKLIFHDVRVRSPRSLIV